MDKVLQIVLQARDDATEKIEKMGDSLQKAADNGEKMAEKMRQAGTVMGGFALAGLGTMSVWAKAAMDAEVETGRYEQTLRKAAEAMKTTTQVISGNEEALKAQEAAIRSEMDAKELQIKQLRLSDGDHKEEIRNIEREIFALEQQANAVKNTTAVKDQIIQIANDAAMSYDQLKEKIDKVAASYVNLAFEDEETANVMAKSVMITKNLDEAYQMVELSADLARAKNTSLTEGHKALATMIQTGSAKALREFGVEIEDGASKADIYEKVWQTVGGQAEQYMNSHVGKIERLSIVLGKLQQDLGDRILKAAEPFFELLRGLATAIQGLPESTLDLIANIVILGTTFASVAAPLLLLAGNWGTLSAFMTAAGTTIMSILPIILIVAGAAYLLYQAWTNNFGGIQEKTQAAAEMIGGAISKLVPFLTDLWNKFLIIGDYVMRELWPIFVFFGNMIKDLGGALMKELMPILKYTWDNLKALGEKLLEIWNIISPLVIPALKVLAVVFGVLILGSIGLVIGVIVGLVGLFNGLIWVVRLVADAFQKWLEDMGKKIQPTIEFVKTLIENIKWVINNVGKMGDNLTNALSNFGIKMHFADGGYVPSTGPAIVHQGEYVLSNAMLGGRQSIDSRILAALGNGGGRNVTINLGGVSVNNKSDADYLVAQLSYQMRASGGM